MVAGKDSASSRAGITTLNNFSGSTGGFDGASGFTMFLCDGQTAGCRMDNIIVEPPQYFNVFRRATDVLNRAGDGQNPGARLNLNPSLGPTFQEARKCGSGHARFETKIAHC
jgi:hypothetical protein